MWIKCSERMPEDGEDVLISTPGKIVDVVMYLDGQFYGYPRVTHWMELPAPPAE